MKPLYIETERFIITEFTESMVTSVHVNSLDADNRRFVPDEVFETFEKAQEMVSKFLKWYNDKRAPLVYPIVLKSGENIGYVQAVPIHDEEWEIGYHISERHTGKGYATEAVMAFLPVIMEQLSLSSIIGECLTDNIASRRVLEKAGFVLKYKGKGKYLGELRDICRYLYERIDLCSAIL